MANENFPQNVRHVQSGEAVSASVTSRPSRDLEMRTNYLRDAVVAIEDGRLLTWKAQRVAPEVLEGQPVYWNAANQRYEQALAQVEIDPASGTLVPKTSCDCTGICLTKYSGGLLADIALGGVTFFSSLANAIDGTVTPGRYYLSSADPGKLVRQKPPISVPVAIVFGPLDACDQNSWVYILPQLGDFLENHIHYRFELYCQPAGSVSPPTPGDIHVITDADATLRGWLPADDPSFAGNAPTGAKFGYNLATHPELARVWPPIPLEAATLFWDKGKDYLGATEVPSFGHDRLVRFDRTGIWWMSDCYGDVPWPTHYDNMGSVPSEMSLFSESSDSYGCPRNERMRVILAFLHMLFTTERTVVTSLQPGANEAIEFVNCDGTPSATGDLWAKLKLAALIDPQEYYGGQVFKELVPPGLKFGLGWTAEGLVADSDYVILTGTHQRGLDPTRAISGTNPAVHQGVVHVDINLDPAERELPPQIVRLGDAMERLHENVPYIGLPPLRNSGIRMRLNVPSAGLPASPVMKIRTMLFGRATGSLPTLTMSYQRLARPALGMPTPIAEGDTPVPFATAGVSVVQDEAIEIESSSFPVAAGDTVLVSIERAATGGYDGGEAGLIRMTGVVTGG